ncbi:PHP domain-containing protein [Brevibacterium album]|uniref:PHP domain-containing protein n=1 Tax=Brevibacterium album TaxID=417948 RepID=UPI0003FFF372|nr:PHP domain-containing protein [Brevibacterium album]
MTADLHTHSRFSDGTQSPAELLAEAAASGLSAVGLTDHDTTAGWHAGACAAAAEGIGLVRGMEVSCRWEGISVHMLCYLHEPEGAEITATITAAREARVVRSRTIVERIAEDHPVSWADVLEIAGPEATIGRPHIADALVRAGVVPDRTAAFADLLASRGRYYVPLPVISPLDAVRMIHEAGGAAVFAHPRASARGMVVPMRGMREIIEAGLDGLEVDHRDNPPDERVRLRRLAQESGLLVTGSSDYHGAGKPNRLGEHTTARDQLMRLIERTDGVPALGV